MTPSKKLKNDKCLPLVPTHDGTGMANHLLFRVVSWNKKTNRQLSYADIMDALKDIKLVELNLGRNVNFIKITELNEMQTQILDLFKMKKID
ncbi:MAG: hypothetical protein ACP5DZ_08025 [Bacteroidales bacterium]